MHLRHLRIFRTVCETENMTKAAERLYLSQPAVSRAVSELEEELGYPLFDRIAKKIYISEAGKLFLAKAVKLLESYEDLKEGSKSYGKRATLRIGSSITIANSILPGAVKQFLKSNPQTSVHVTVDNAKEIEALLVQNEIDIALIEGVISHQQLAAEPFSSHTLSAVCAPDHPFAGRKKVKAAELAEQPLLLREKGSAIRSAFESAMLLKNLPADPFYTSVNSQALIQAAKQGLGITVLPDIILKEELEKGNLFSIQAEGFPIKSVSHIVYHKDKFRSEAFHSFGQIVRTTEIKNNGM